MFCFNLEDFIFGNSGIRALEERSRIGKMMERSR
jgi:hypothetical protein